MLRIYKAPKTGRFNHCGLSQQIPDNPIVTKKGTYLKTIYDPDGKKIRLIRLIPVRRVERNTREIVLEQVYAETGKNGEQLEMNDDIPTVISEYAKYLKKPVQLEELKQENLYPNDAVVE